MCDLCIKETNLHKNSKTIEYYIDSDGCWICTSHPKDHGGYCHIVRNRKVSLAHRYVYELLIKKIKEGLHHDTGDYSHLDLAIIFGVNKSTIGRIIRYNTWKETT